MNVCKPLVVAALFITSGCTTIEQVVIETEATYVQLNAAARLGSGSGHEKSAQSVGIMEYEPQVREEDLWELQQQLDAQKAKAQLYGAASLAAAHAPKKSIASKVPVLLWFCCRFSRRPLRFKPNGKSRY